MSPHYFGLLPELICCRKTTEPGADEVIFRLVGTCSDRSKNFAIDYDPINMNDGGQPTNNSAGDSGCITPEFFAGGRFFSAALSDNEKWLITLVVNEQDGGNSVTAQEILAGMLAQTGNPWAMAASAIVEVLTELGLHFTDTDDYIGSFSFRLHVNNGAISTGFTPIERCDFKEIENDSNGEPRKLHCVLNGDGSDYDSYFYIDLFS